MLLIEILTWINVIKRNWIKKSYLWIAVVLFGILAFTGCTGQQQDEATSPAESSVTPPAGQSTEPPVDMDQASRTLTVMTHDSFAMSEEVVAAFEQENNVQLVFLPSGDAGTSLNKAILSKGNPIADVFYGVDNTFISRALEEDIFEPYHSPLLDSIPDEYELGEDVLGLNEASDQALPVDWGDVCLNYDKAYFEENNLAPPGNLEDLLKSEYNGLVVVENPATSSPGLAFLLATIGHFGEDGYLDYWQGLLENDVLVVNDWETAYYSEFSRAGGARPVVVSYGSSPAFEVLYAEQPMEEAPTGVVTGDGSCFRQIEYVGILEGTANRDLAEKWIDFMLSPTFQEAIPLQMFVFPVNQDVTLEDLFSEHMAIPENPAEVSPQAISANREAWIQAWTEAVLR